MGLLSFLNPIENITNAITKTIQIREAAKNDRDRLAADERIRTMEIKRDAMIAASVNDRWWSPRNLMGTAVAIYVLKIVVWDSVLGWGVTPYPGQQVTFIVMTVIGFYFVSKGAEKIADTIATAIAGRSSK